MRHCRHCCLQKGKQPAALLRLWPAEMVFLKALTSREHTKHQMLFVQIPSVQALHRRIVSLAHPARYNDSLLHSAPSDAALLANLYPR